MKHKHAELIKAWADGAEIEFNTGHGWNLARLDDFNNERWDFRIKPEENQPVVRWQWAFKTLAGWQSTSSFYTDSEVMYTKPERVKLEYTRTEFPE